MNVELNTTLLNNNSKYSQEFTIGLAGCCQPRRRSMEKINSWDADSRSAKWRKDVELLFEALG
jgi:hypothetical protein